MSRSTSLAILLSLASGVAVAQEDSPSTTPDAGTAPAEAAPSEASPSQPELTEPAAAAPAPTTEAPAPGPVTISQEELDRLRTQIKSELREEMRSEVERASREAAQQKRAAQEWEEESWVEEVKPKLNFIDFDGYFRTRVDLFQRAHLGTYDPEIGRGTSYVPPPLNYRAGSDRHDTLTTANMRLRLDPTLNVSEDIRVRMTVDILDNLVLGSTPDTYPGLTFGGQNPLSAFTTSQLPPAQGFNSLFTDSIKVRRVWGEVTTPFGQVRFGRMASHFGLGLVANDGNCLECDYGNNADRLMFITRILGHYIIPAYEFTATGPIGRGGGPGANAPPMWNWTEIGQAYDLDTRDDVRSFILAIAKRDSPADIREKLSAGGFVLNYGVYGVYRMQTYDTPLWYGLGSPSSQPQIYPIVPRSAWAGIGSLWGLFQWRKLKIEGELSGIYGHVGNMQTSGDISNDMVRNYQYDAAGNPTYYDSNGNLLPVPHCYVLPNLNSFTKRGTNAEDRFNPRNIRFPPDPSQGFIDLGEGACIRQLGFAIEGSYAFLNDTLVIGGGMGYASGDDAPGFGIRPGSNNFQPTKKGDFDGRQFGSQYPDGTTDNTIENFRFNPDYRVDMLMFREVMGTVTDAVYVKPSITYYLPLEGLGVRADAIAAVAQYATSTPGQNNLLGAEFNGHLFYRSEDGFYGGFTYAFLLPLAGFHHYRCGANENEGVCAGRSGLYTNVSGDDANSPAQQQFGEAKFAHRFHGILGIQF